MSKEEEGAGNTEPEAAPRSRVSETRCIGLVIEWRGYMGWIQPLTKIEHELASKHKGRVYLNQKDVAAAGGRKVKEGSIVDFFVYTDNDGLGAEECQVRTVLRMTLPHSEFNKLKLTPQWSEYLSSSQYYPDFSLEHNVLLRTYTWQLPFAVIELWGDVETLSKTAVHLATVNHEKKEDEEECNMRLLVPEGAVARAEALAMSPKISERAIVTAPTRCRNVIFGGSKEKCIENTQAFIQAMSPAAAGA
jgi:hypothetical protein